MPMSYTDAQVQVWTALDIFNPANLRAGGDVDRAVNIVENSLDESIGIIQFSLQYTHHHIAFAFILSAVSDGHAGRISNFLLNNFPSNIKRFYDSIGYKSISRLSQTLRSLSFPPHGKPPGLDSHLHHGERGLVALDELRKVLAVLDTSTNRGTLPSGLSPDIESSVQRFEALGLQFPRTRLSAEDTIQRIIDGQRNILKFYLRSIRVSQTKSLICEAYLGDHNIRQSSTTERFDAELTTVDLDFESATGFGKWRLYCSNSCLRALARDREQARLSLKKLRELSFGCFSETNQKRLTRYSPVDIFQARLPGDLRLVYHVDVISEFGADCESQVLRIIGNYRLTELKRVNWDAVGNRQARYGKEYIEKCRARSSCHGHSFDPITFGESRPVEGISAVTEDAEEDTDEIRRLLELEKFSVLSQNVVRDILNGDDHYHIFQISQEEQDIIYHNLSTFVLGRSGTGKTTVILYKIFGIERAWQNQGSVGARPRQIFITKSCRLADKVEEEYVGLLFSLCKDSDMPEHARERIQRWEKRKKMDTFDPDNAGSSTRDDLPPRYSQLLDEHFPMFVTMDTLYSLLEADFIAGSSEIQGYSSKDLLTFDGFKNDYWLHLPQHLTKGISPILAFSDFIGLIKGSEKSLSSPNRILDKEEYQSLRRTNNVDYALFEAYERLRRKSGHHDPADRTHALLYNIRASGLRAKSVDFVYVDEVQDILLIDTQVILALCENIDRFLWAGDTAQTISVGSTFTFKELGASIWRHQRSNQALRRTLRQPESFQLLKNYRSHSGIVRCANAILDFLHQFPGAIDPLQPEVGVVGRRLPEFFHAGILPSRVGDFFFVQPGVLAKLGSNQCVIVRDELSRQNFKDQIGHTGVVLTLFGSKGLEYDDVIIFDFFKASAKPNLWRHLIGADRQDLWDEKFMPLIHELKCLYVAITRARHRLWIIDSSDEYQPLMRFLLDRGLVVEPPPGCNSIRLIAKETNPEEWLAEGKRLLDFNEFGEALMAFRRAGNPYMAAVATACHLRQVARETSASTPWERRDAFAKAADSFERCSKMTENPKEQRAHYAAAARCYAEGKSHQNAVRTFKLAKMYTEAALHYFHNHLIDEAVSIVKKDRVHLDQETIEVITQDACLMYLKAKRLEDAAALFEDDEEMMAFVKKHGLWEARALILEKQGKYGEAIKQYFEIDQAPTALDVFLRHIDHTSRDLDTLNAITMRFLWRYLSFGRRTWPRKCAGVRVEKIVALLDALLSQNLGERGKNMVNVFRFIVRGSRSQTSEKDLADVLLHCHGRDKAIELLGLDYLFDRISPILSGPSLSDAISALRFFCRYSTLIKEAVSTRSPWELPWVCTLFQIKKDGISVQIMAETFLYGAHGTLKNPPVDQSGALLSPSEFNNIFKRLLSERLRTRVIVEDGIASNLSLFGPCVQFASNRKCREPHAASHSHQHNDSWFNQQVRYHLLRVMTLDNLLTISKVGDLHSLIIIQRRLLHALERASEPPACPTKSKFSLKHNLTPEARDGFLTVKGWALDTLKELSRPRGRLLRAFDGSQDEVTMELKNGWEKMMELDRVRSAVSKVTQLVELILVPGARFGGSGFAWDGLTLYRLREEGANVPWPYY